jgi:hypothetical protein
MMGAHGNDRQLVQERLPPERAEAARSSPPTCAAATADDDGQDTGPCTTRSGAFEPRGVARRRPDGGASTRPALSRLRAGRLGLETNRRPALPRRPVSAELQARPGIVRVPHPTLGTSRPTAARPDRAPQRRWRPSRSCTPSSTGLTPELAARGRRALGVGRRVVRASPTARARRAPRRGRAEGRAHSDGWPRSSPFLEWLARDTPSRRALLRLVAARCGSSPARARGCSTTRRARPGLPVAVRRSIQPARAGGGDAARVQDNRLSPVHRRVRMDYVGSAGSRRTASVGRRAVGLFTTWKPASETPVLHHSCSLPGPDRRLARLQGGGHALRVLPKDELFAAPTRT